MLILSMAKKRGSEQLARDRASSQGIGKRRRSRHKAGESSRQGNRVSIKEEALKAIILEKIKEEVKEEIKEEIKKELKEKLREEVKEELKEELKEDVKEELNEVVKEELRRQKKNIRRMRKQLEELKEKAALERPDDAFLARRSELHESSQLNLRITSTVNSVIYKRRPIETNDGQCVVVTMFDGTDKIAPDHRLSSAEVELVILNGAFNGAAEERWSKQEFEDQIFDNLIEGKSGTEKMNQKKDIQGCQPMIKNSIFKLNCGSCSHKGAHIMGNSNRGEFRLGVRLVGHATERVLEGISNPFKVQEYKTKENAKHDIPSVDSEIWRLRRIARNSDACSAIEKKGIDTVGRLLISYHEDNDKLREILRGPYHRSADVDAIIEHAKRCEDGLCSYTTSGITLFFNQLETLVGVENSDCYYHFSLLEESVKDVVRGLESNAREHKAAWRLDYKMENGRPKPWLPKVSKPFNEKNIVGSGSSVPTSAQMEEKAQATIGCDERIQMMHNPSAQASSSNVHNVQGEAGLGLGNTGEPSAERNSVVAHGLGEAGLGVGNTGEPSAERNSVMTHVQGENGLGLGNAGEPSAERNSVIAHVQGEASLGLGNTSEPSAERNSVMTHVQGEAGLGLGNTSEPSAERNSVMAHVPATDDRTRQVLNDMRPQDFNCPPLDLEVPQDFSWPALDLAFTLIFDPDLAFSQLEGCLQDESTKRAKG